MSIFNPSRDEVREFFVETWRKHRQQSVLTPLESMALSWIQRHPEYHAYLEDEEIKDKDFSVNQGEVNPFLHLSMHLAIEEQISIDSPPGIRQAFEQLSAKTSPHDAIHEIMECLGQVIWQAQRNGQAPNHDLYMELLHKRIHTL